jgi:hypothetical protein
MREIKFRGKRIDTGEWVEGSYVSKFSFTDGSVHENTIVTTDGLKSYLVHPETVGQFIGLKDIYEGDVYRDEFSVDDEKGMDERIYYVCAFVKSMCAFCWITVAEYNLGVHEEDVWPADDEYPVTVNADELDKIKVIGNSHDKPELLK